MAFAISFGICTGPSGAAYLSAATSSNGHTLAAGTELSGVDAAVEIWCVALCSLSRSFTFMLTLIFFSRHIMKGRARTSCPGTHVL